MSSTNPLDISNLNPNLVIKMFPEPELLARYEALLPGFTNKFFEVINTGLAEQAVIYKARIDQVDRESNRQIDITKRGQVCAFLIGSLAILSGTFCAYFDRELAASFIGGGGVVGLCTVFLVNSRVKYLINKPADPRPVLEGAGNESDGSR